MKLAIYRLFSILMSGVASVALVGCGGTGQDEGTPSNVDQRLSGVGIDGYLARATVFVDTNANGARDSWEPWAFTDNQGYYSNNPITGRNYCSDDATPQERQYCLNVNVEYGNALIRIDSGYDVTTGEPFIGQLSRRVNTLVQSEVENTIVSPISSLLSSVESEEDRQSVLTSLNITEADLDIDYLNDSNSTNGVNAPLLNTALKIHKVVSVLSDRLTDTYTEIGDSFGTPNDATSVVYPNLAAQIVNAQTSLGQNLDEVLSDRNVMASVLDEAETSLRAVYERREFDLPADMGSSTSPEGFSRVIEVASGMSTVVNNLIDRDDSTLNFDDATGSTRALESFVIRTVNETNEDNATNVDSSIDDVIRFFDTGNSDNVEEAQQLVRTLVTSLTEDSADVAGLSETDFTTLTSVETIQAETQASSDAGPFSELGGNQLRIFDIDLGTAPDDLEDKEIEFYFNGAPTDTDGDFIACLKYIDEANVDGTLGDGNTRGELVDGYWSMLGATEENPSTYSLLVTISFLGSTYQAIMKPKGMETVDGVEYYAIRSDSGGDFKTQYSEDGLTEIISRPTTNQDCRDRMPSRVGL